MQLGGGLHIAQREPAQREREQAQHHGQDDTQQQAL